MELRGGFPFLAALGTLASLALGGGNASLLGAERVLFPFGPGFDTNTVGTTDASVAPAEHGLLVHTGHRQPWPGIALHPPGGHIDLLAFGEITLRVSNTGSHGVSVCCRVDNPEADGVKHCITDSVSLEPGRTKILRVRLPHAGDDRLGGKLFGMRGYPVSARPGDAFTPTNVTQLLVFVSQPTQDYSFEIGPVNASGEYTPPTAWTSDADPFFPFIDTFGQYRHKSWPGKVLSLDDLTSRVAAEERDMAAHPGPAGWDRFGGFAAGPQRQATGFFRTEKVGAKWWLVDPDGHLFFSHGIDCVGAVDHTPVEERETWFADFPGAQPGFRQFFSTGYALKGHYEGRSPRSFSFGGANLLRKFGPGWSGTSREIIHRRLRSWGLNTIGNWSDGELCHMRRTAYTDAIGSGRTRMIQGSEGYWGRFPDVFDPGFAGSLRQAMESKRGTSVGDPWCLGYFSDNEMSWGDETSLAVAALKSGADQPAKQAFLVDLKAKYERIETLNQAWGATHASWEALAGAKEAPDAAKARADLTAFYTKVAETYFRTVRDAVRSVAPHQLYLGCRFAWVNERAARAAAKYCDVVSYNIYHHGVADFEFNGGADVPLLIGEFHFGALDRGMFHTGLVPTANQAERARAYQEYLRGALKHPQFVGCHWFQYKDEPVLGRVYDEENYQIGFVDVADTPYAETIAASREIGAALYSQLQ